MAVLDIRPSGAGTLCAWPKQNGNGCPNHYQNVDNGDTPTWGVAAILTDDQGGDAWYTDVYAMGDHGAESGVINKITLGLYLLPGWAVDRTSYKYCIHMGGTLYESAALTLTTEKWYEVDYATNPDSAAAWTWTDIDNLQVGVSGRGPFASDPKKQTICAGVRVYVDYTAAISASSGGVSAQLISGSLI